MEVVDIGKLDYVLKHHPHVAFEKMFSAALGIAKRDNRIPVLVNPTLPAFALEQVYHAQTYTGLLLHLIGHMKIMHRTLYATDRNGRTDTYDLERRRVLGMLRIISPDTMIYYHTDVKQYQELPLI